VAGLYVGASAYVGAGFSRPTEALTVAGPSGLFTWFPCFRAESVVNRVYST